MPLLQNYYSNPNHDNNPTNSTIVANRNPKP